MQNILKTDILSLQNRQTPNLTNYLIVCFIILIQCNAIVAQEKGNDFENIERHSNKYEKYKALGGNIFVGYGLLNGNISKYFTDPFFFGINVDIIRQKFVIQIDDYIGFGKTKKTMEFPNDWEWSKNKIALHFTGGGNFGYTLINSESFKLVPLAGIGLNVITSDILDSNDNSLYEPLFPYYKVGCYIDIKSFRLFRNNYSFNYNDDYTCIRLSFGLSRQIVTRKYDSFYQGNMIYFTIGMGGLATGGLAR
jgi:hypothetical protein